MSRSGGCRPSPTRSRPRLRSTRTLGRTQSRSRHPHSSRAWSKSQTSGGSNKGQSGARYPQSLSQTFKSHPGLLVYDPVTLSDYTLGTSSKALLLAGLTVNGGDSGSDDRTSDPFSFADEIGKRRVGKEGRSRWSP